MKLLALLLLLFASVFNLHAQENQRKRAQKLYDDDNFKESLEIYLRLLENTKDKSSHKDLNRALDCHRRLGQVSDSAALIEKNLTSRPDDYLFLHAAALHYITLPHHGYIVAGEFKRGNHRGGGRYAGCEERDRIRAIQLSLAAIEKAPADLPKTERGQFYSTLANLVSYNRMHHSAWKFQILSDLTKLPDVEPGSRWGRGGRSAQGAPVTADNQPLFYSIPETWQQAKNDGERWRWALDQAEKLNPGLKVTHQRTWADFLHSQFGVGTMAHYGWFSNMDSSSQKGILQVHTLEDDETLARLASGVQRFKLPAEQNYIAILKNLSGIDHQSADKLIRIYLDRRQFPKAVDLLEKTIKKFPSDRRSKLLKQITGDWGKFDYVSGSTSKGKEPILNYTFRNAKEVTLTVRPVAVKNIINDLWKKLEGNPLKLNWGETYFHGLGNSLINGNRKKYLGKETARRTHKLTPRPHHWDTRASLSVPVTKPGTYLVSALLEDGETVHAVVRIDSHVIVRQGISGGTRYFVADAETGKAIPKARLEFFGFRQVNRKKPGVIRKYDVFTKRSNKTSDANGIVTIKNGELDSKMRWMVRVLTDDGIAWLGFGNSNSSIYRSGSLHNRKAFGITDRPVYQPKQKVYGKFWMREAKYDLGDESVFAGKRFSVHIHAPDGSEVSKQTNILSDSYGGIEYEYDLPDDAKLGSYRVVLRQGESRIGSHHFRVEEYKKPEYEVTIDAPKDPVMLGEKFAATIKARYYHGAPVTNAKVKIKVLRTRHNERWFPMGRWDWLYGKGYGWLDIERPWYPGWQLWGCRCPLPWWHRRGGEQPEIVLERNLNIGENGEAKLEIDSKIAKMVHGDTDHRYEITAEVVDASRRTIVGKGSVLATRKPFNISLWLDRGYAHVGDPIHATAAARTLDGKHVTATGSFKLYRVVLNDGQVKETLVKEWKAEVSKDQDAKLKFQAAEAGQYRLAATLTDGKGRTIEGATIFTVRGEGEADGKFIFSDLELITDKRTYAKGEKVKLLIQTKRPNSTVLLSLRGGAEHQLIHLTGNSAEVLIPVEQKDMPNFFIQAATVSNARVHTTVREVIVPPEKRLLNVQVLTDQNRYKPRADGKVKVRITDHLGEPVKGSLALTIYDKSLEYISGGSNVTSIAPYYWKWRRHFRNQYFDSQGHDSRSILKNGAQGMRSMGIFGHSLADGFSDGIGGGGGFERDMAMPKSAVRYRAANGALADKKAAPTAEAANEFKSLAAGGEDAASVMVRKDFADLIKWIGSVETDADGVAEVPVKFPDNLTTWKIKTWAMSHGTRVGEGSAEVITSKDLILRLQAPRFFIEKDEVVLSAIVHNYLKTEQAASVSIELEGGTLTTDSPLTQKQTIPPGGETRIDWRARVTQEGKAIVRMKVITPDDSDAMEMTFPVYVHGILKQQAWSHVLAQGENSHIFKIDIPAERRPEQSRLEIRYSPTIAGSIVDALPYLVEYPHGCTEQTLNRFVPTVITQKLLREMGINLEDVRNKRANLNPQEIGDDKVRMAQWKRWQRNPVFSVKEVNKMTSAGIKKLSQMQCSDGGWGWFSGWGERSYPHTTSVVVHGLLIARQNGAAIPENMLKRGVAWLKQYEARETEKIRMWEKRKRNTKPHATSTDAFVRLVLAEAKVGNKEMLGFLFRDKSHHSVYVKCLTGMAMHLAEENKNRDAMIRNIEQFLVHDDENQTSYLKLGNNSYWWYWYGSEMEAHAWYLKLLAATKPKSKQARGLVKYLINNRKHSTYWNSTRDTAYCIEAIAEYMRASGENEPNVEVTVKHNGKAIKTVKITKENLFSYDNKVVIAGDVLNTGQHQLEIVRKTPNGKTTPLYTNAYLTVFTKENFISKAGLEVKVERAYYKLERIAATEATAGTRGQVIDHKIVKYKRIPLKSGDQLKSGDLVEVELHIHSKNDYEYLMFEDWKPAGLEAVNVRSGYTSSSQSGMHTYMEMHHERTSFFVRQLARGSHSIKYRLRAEIPGKFSALPTKAEAMYAPELRANSDEMKLEVSE